MLCVNYVRPVPGKQRKMHHANCPMEPFDLDKLNKELGKVPEAFRKALPTHEELTRSVRIASKAVNEAISPALEEWSKQMFHLFNDAPR